MFGWEIKECEHRVLVFGQAGNALWIFDPVGLRKTVSAASASAVVEAC
jgi:hypothetical protein